MIEERIYWLAWGQIDGIGATLLYRIQQHFGSLATAWNAPIETLRAINGFGEVLMGKIATNKPKIDPEATYTRYLLNNPHFWTPSDPEYPRLLLEITSPPSLLHYRGTVDIAENSGEKTLIGIVGTREPTEYGKKWTHKLSKSLSRHGMTVVSGMAAGIDTIAHYACLEAGGRTIAVWGAGLDRLYPPENAPLEAEIRQHGLILSEYEAKTAPDRRTFPARNRIIAGICRAVIVMEAPKHSGALITARYANEFGRDVYILPASLDQPQSIGCLELVSQGAQLILSEEHLLEMLGTIPQLAPSPEIDRQLIPATATPTKERQKTISPPPDLEPKQALVWQTIDSIAAESIALETIAQNTGMATGELTATLLELELLGLVTQLPGMRYRRL